MGYKGEHWAMLKKKKKNNYKKKATHSLDGELVKHLALNPPKHIFSALVLSKRDFYCATIEKSYPKYTFINRRNMNMHTVLKSTNSIIFRDGPNGTCLIQILAPFCLF